jgi:hypothetical protein
LGAIIARSTSGALTAFIDALRSQGVGLDGFIARWVRRIFPRRTQGWPEGPPLLVAPTAAPTPEPAATETAA